MNMEQPQLPQADHDLLIAVNTNLIALRTEMQSSNQTRSAEHADHEARLRVLEKESNTSAGMTTGAKVVIGSLFTLIGIVEPLVLVYLTKG